MKSAPRRSVRCRVFAVLVGGLPLIASADVPGPGPRTPRPWEQPAPPPQPAPEPAPLIDLCAGKVVGDACELPAQATGAPSVAGQCVPTTCPTPQPSVLQYSCIQCESRDAPQQQGWSTDVDRAAALSEAANDATNDSPPRRLWMSLLVGALALGSGMLLIARNARKRRR
jgi:hypothetical protein